MAWFDAGAEKKLIKTAKPGRDGTVRVTFALPRDTPGGAVSVVGDFNGWDPFAHPLRRRTNGTRSAAGDGPTGPTTALRRPARGGSLVDRRSRPARGCRGRIRHDLIPQRQVMPYGCRAAGGV